MLKTIVSLSGGLDSAVLLSQTVKDKDPSKIRCFSFNYGSKHNEYENRAARKIASHYKVCFDLIDISGIMKHFKSALLLTGEDIPEGHYEDKSMSKTVVPSRNMIFISILSGIAESIGYREIQIGVHAGDHAIYPDCRPEFIDSMCDSVHEGTGQQIVLSAPFLNLNKKNIVALGHALGTPFELTRTCYKNQRTACGKCGSCVERLEAFQENAIKDPIKYKKDKLCQ